MERIEPQNSLSIGFSGILVQNKTFQNSFHIKVTYWTALSECDICFVANYLSIVTRLINDSLFYMRYRCAQNKQLTSIVSFYQINIISEIWLIFIEKGFLQVVSVSVSFLRLSMY